MSLVAEFDPSNRKPDVRAAKDRAKALRYYQNHEKDIKAKRAYHCSCGAIFTGTGSHKRASVHTGYGHTVTKGAQNQSLPNKGGCKT